MKQGASRNGGLLVVAGHAIYQDRRWHGGFPGEERCYEGHILDGLAIARSEGYAAVSFSGGWTRDRRAGFPSEVTNSEAEGMLELAREVGAIGDEPPRVLTEGYARDSFENVFFSMACFHRSFGAWPSRVGVVSWKFKALRFYLIACGLRLGDGAFTFHGSGDLDTQRVMEVVAAANAAYEAMMIDTAAKAPAIGDPLHRHRDFANKRMERTPRRFGDNAEYLRLVKQAYDVAQGPVSRCIDEVEAVVPGAGWRSVSWPWRSPT